MTQSFGYRLLAWGTAALLLIAHGPGALAGRLLVTTGLAPGFQALNRVLHIGNPPGVENQDVIVMNSPSMLMLAYVPFDKAYSHQPIPRTVRTLVPGCTSVEVERSDDTTLVIQPKAPDIFACDDFGPFHKLYAVRFSNMFLGELDFKQGERLERGSVTVEILELDTAGLPSRVAFHFKASLDSPAFHWLRFDFPTRSYQPFPMPPVGQRVTVSGPEGE